MLRLAAAPRNVSSHSVICRLMGTNCALRLVPEHHRKLRRTSEVRVLDGGSEQMIELVNYGHGAKKLIGLHGWFGDETTFSPLESSLDPDLFECAWLAHRGYGRSLGIPGRYDMREMAQDTIDVADRLGWSTFSLIGHSMGGKAVQVVAAEAPARVEQIIGLAPVGAGPVPMDPMTRELFARAVEERQARFAIVDYSTANRLSPAWVESLVSGSFERSTKQAFAAYFHSWADDDLSSVIVDSDSDVLVLVGADDPVITSSFCEAGFADRYSRLSIKQLNNSGHYPADELPLVCGAEVARFLLR